MAKKSLFLYSQFFLTPVFAILILSLSTQPSTAQNAQNAQKFVVEVCENGSRFISDGDPVFEDGLPAYGNEFITEGYIYPVGTLVVGESCINDDGTPKYPEKILGTWTCRGWHVGNGARTETGPMVITTQNFDFGDVPGQKMVVTDGFELADFNVPVTRPIVGSTGLFDNKARGESIQTLFDFSGDPIAVKLRVEFTVAHP